MRLPTSLTVVLCCLAIYVHAAAGTSPASEDPDTLVGDAPVIARYIEVNSHDEIVQRNEVPDSRWTTEQLTLRDNLRDCLATCYLQPGDVSQRSPWSVMHDLLGYGVDTQVVAGGQPVNAISWLCWNRPCRGQRLFSMKGAALQTHEGPGLQGHAGQFLAMLAQARVQSTYPMKVDRQDLTVADLIRHEQQTCDSQTELTFKLIGLSFYLDSDATWENQAGETWSLSRLIAEELGKPVVQDAPCGGTHRLMGLSHAVRKRQTEGGTFDGEWNRARKFIEDFHDYAFKVQNPDGSFSTEWFQARGASEDLQRRLQTTGHILEWLVYSLPPEELTQPRVTKSVQYLTTLMLDNPRREWAAGPKGHALHALALYDERVFGSQPGQRAGVLADRHSNRSDIR